MLEGTETNLFLIFSTDFIFVQLMIIWRPRAALRSFKQRTMKRICLFLLYALYPKRSNQQSL